MMLSSLPQIIFDGEVIDEQLKKGDEFMTFDEPVKPTEAPTEEPTTVEPTTVEPTTVEPTTVEPTTVEPTTEQTATITIYGFNGQSETKTFNVGDTFDVYTYLNASDLADGGKLANVNASQTYTDSVVELNSTAYPVLGDAVVENKDQAGKVLYIASTPSVENPFVFDSDDDVMIKTTYTVTAGGEGEIRNAIRTMAAADEDLTPIIKNGDPVDPTKEIPVEASFTERVPAPTEVPVPTEEPTTVEPTTVEPTTVEPTTVEPTTVEPTTVEPTTVEPTTVEPTTVEPTTVEPTTVEPTTVEPTTVEPTTVEPTTVEPTTVEPTTVEPTTVEPTQPGPSGDKIYINADGNLYEVEAGSDHTYTFFLKNAGMIYGIDAATTWDAPYIQMVGDPSFPVFGDGRGDIDDEESAGNVVYNYFNDKDGNINEISFNWTKAEGVDCGERADVITFTVHVDENTPAGTYYITTKVKTLEGPEEQKQIFMGTDTVDPPVDRDGELDGAAGEKQTDTYTVDGKQTYQQTSGENKTFTVKAEKNRAHAADKFRSLWIDLKGDGNYTLVSYDAYTVNASEDGADITLNAAYMDTLGVGDYKLKFVFADGETTGDLTVTEAPTTPGKDETTSPEKSTEKGTAPAATTKGSSSTTDTASSTNGAAVQTGSPEAAIIFVVLLVMAAGIIIFNKKRREDN